MTLNPTLLALPQTPPSMHPEPTTTTVTEAPTTEIPTTTTSQVETPTTEVEVFLAPATSIAAPVLPHTGVDTNTSGTVGAILLALGMIATALAQRCNR